MPSWASQSQCTIELVLPDPAGTVLFACHRDPIFSDLCFCLFRNISGRVMLIDDVIVNVDLFSGCYSLSYGFKSICYSLSCDRKAAERTEYHQMESL